jgi:lycopene beta-cyclase
VFCVDTVGTRDLPSHTGTFHTIRSRKRITIMRILIATFVVGIASAFLAVPNTLKRKTSFVLSSADKPETRRPPEFSKKSITRVISASTRLFAERKNGDTEYDDTCDVLVLGSGPAGRAMASLLGAGGGLNVLLADQNFDRAWAPNYGVWKDEWTTILDKYRTFGIEIEGGNEGESVDREWQVTDCYFGGSFDIPTENRMRLDRPYVRVDKNALRESLTKNFRIVKANHISEAIGANIYKPAGSLIHDEDGTTIKLQSKDQSTPIVVRAKIIIDTTGHETKLVLKEARETYSSPGFQIAYGALVEVDESNSPDLTHLGPYDKEAMTLFDYRTDHFSDESDLIKATKAPTFMYAMPLKDNQVFFEETSLVARPAMSFQECKDRCFIRLESLGIKVTKIVEEEFCYIPMGGALPQRDQRILGFGGAAAMVHPSTGYHICRALMGATDAAYAIKKELASDKPNLDRAVASAYHALWSPENVRQRNFAVFGGEYLMKQDVVGLRGFFVGFFRLPLELWGGFLAGWPGLAYNESHESWLARIWFGLNFIIKIPPVVAVDMAASIVKYCITDFPTLAQSVTPFLGEPESYEYKRNMDRIGDVVSIFLLRYTLPYDKSFSSHLISFPATGCKDRSSQNDRGLVGRRSSTGGF